MFFFAAFPLLVFEDRSAQKQKLKYVEATATAAAGGRGSLRCLCHGDAVVSAKPSFVDARHISESVLTLRLLFTYLPEDNLLPPRLLIYVVAAYRRSLARFFCHQPL